MITFTCWYNEKSGVKAKVIIIYCTDRKEALGMIRKGDFDNYKNVVVSVGNEKFNLNSKRGYDYFGIKK